jgi:hypothetical protein
MVIVQLAVQLVGGGSAEHDFCDAIDPPHAAIINRFASVMRTLHCFPERFDFVRALLESRMPNQAELSPERPEIGHCWARFSVTSRTG